MLFRDKTKKVPFYNGILCLLKSQVQLREVHGVESCEKVAVCLKPFTDPVFNDLERKISDLVVAGVRTTHTDYKEIDDEYGFRWILLVNPKFEDLVAMVYTITQLCDELDTGTRIAAIVFPFTSEGKVVHWVYNHQRGTFYPFVPIDEGKFRDSVAEFDLYSRIKNDLPLEDDLSKWYPLWGIPFASLDRVQEDSR